MPKMKRSGRQVYSLSVPLALCTTTMAGFAQNATTPGGLQSYSTRTRKSGCSAIDAGVAMPNINDGYTGKAPDLGAYEFGKPLPHFGPRHLPVQGGEPLP